jgi:hypothetical protein
MTSPEEKNDLLDGAFEKIKKKISKPVDPVEQPEQFVRELHKVWRAEGGQASGKRRHSDRFLDERLKQAKTPVRSLTPKLTGKTHIKPRDGATLVKFFLSSWPEGGEDDGAVTYKALIPVKEIGAVAEAIDEYISDAEDVPAAEVTTTDPAASLPGEDAADLILRFYEECDAYIAVSPEQTLITPQPRTALIGFRRLIDRFWAIERRGKKIRPLIWILDIGDRNIEDLENRAKFLNVQSLLTRLKALQFFEERDTAERWQWLQSRVVIVIQDSRRDMGAEMNMPRRPSFVAHNISFAAVAPGWLPHPSFRTLYGSNLERVQERNFTVLYNSASTWQSDSEWDVEDFRYLGFATFAAQPEAKSRGMELPPLGLRYVEGFRTVCSAAAHTLNISYPPGDETLPNGGEAIQQLRYLGYFVLRLNEFLEDY